MARQTAVGMVVPKAEKKAAMLDAMTVDNLAEWLVAY
jgi:hypothetical protein